VYQTNCFPNPLIRTDASSVHACDCSGGTNTNVELLRPPIRGGIETVERKYRNLAEEALR
jgi:hypothetical protein